ncbi:MAG: tripartite tricarboxylate transporter substrate binding protein [Pseudomonadota bacterium]
MKAFNAVVRMVTVGVLMGLAGSVAAQQTYPSKSIRFIVAFPPGGTNNLLARFVGQKLTESWGQQVIVENRPGGNTIIGTEALAKSAPDGYSIMVMSSTHVIVPQMQKGVPYDAIRDFAPVATLDSQEFVLVVHPSLPVSNLQQFISLAKSKPGQLNYATTGSGGVQHLATELFSLMTGARMQHIPYKGSSPALTDLVGGQVEVHFAVPYPAIPFIKSGRIKAIAISGEARLAALPQVPTFSEAGLPGYDVKWWHGILAPAGTPRVVIDKLSSEVAKILGMPDTREKFHGLGLEPFISSPDQFDALMKADMAKWGKVIKSAHIKMEN